MKILISILFIVFISLSTTASSSSVVDCIPGNGIYLGGGIIAVCTNACQIVPGPGGGFEIRDCCGGEVNTVFLRQEAEPAPCPT